MYVDHYGQTWYKGNLHTHTTRSDGSQSPELIAARYRHAGYDFLSVTDHFNPNQSDTVSETVETPDFLLLAGTEYGTRFNSERDGIQRGGVIHIIGTGFTEPPEYRAGFTSQDIVDAIRQKDGLAIIAHPHWSRNLPEDVLAASGYDGIEVFNSLCERHFMRMGYAEVMVDQLACLGFPIPVIAADDTHGHNGLRTEEFGGFIMVQAGGLSRDNIVRAIRERRFFASQGPWVQAKIEGSHVYVECTPTVEVKVITNMLGAMGVGGQPMTGARFDMSKPSWSPVEPMYYRVEVIDEHGKKAWTHPVRVPAAEAKP